MKTAPALRHPHDRLAVSADDTCLDEGLSLVSVQNTHRAVIAHLARPEKCNAISLDLIRDLNSLVQRLLESGETKPFVLRGSGKWFASGGDLKEFSTLTAEQAVGMAHLMSGALRGIERLPGATIAALNGPAIGGGFELALAFDMRVASERAYVRFAQTRMGITSGWQGIDRLCRLVGYSATLHLMLTGKQLSAQEALHRGLVNEVWPDETFETDLGVFLDSVLASAEAGLAIKRVLQACRPELSSGEMERALLKTLWDQPARLEAMENALSHRNTSRS